MGFEVGSNAAGIIVIDQGRLFRDKKRKPPRESITLAICKKYLCKRGIFHLRLNSGKIFYQGRWIHLCPIGTPDLFVLYKGVALFVETKRQGEKPTSEQLRTHEFIRQSGGRVIVAESVEELRDALIEIDAQQRGLPR